MIKYKIYSPGFSMLAEENPDSSELKMYFTPGRIFIKSSKGGKLGGEEDDILIILDSAKIYSINNQERTFSVKKLREVNPMPPATKEIIAGYKCTPLDNTIRYMSESIGTNATLWFADDLFFSLPSKFEANDELLMIRDNRILLKAKYWIDERLGIYSDRDETENNLPLTLEITFIAEEVLPGLKPPFPFDIPKGYQKIAYNPFKSDSTPVWIDSVLINDSMRKEAIPDKKTKEKPGNKAKSGSKTSLKKED